MRSAEILILSLALLSAGCQNFSLVPSHLHNQANADAASKAQSELNAYASGNSSVYTAMIDNVNKFKAEEDSLLGDFATNNDLADAMTLTSSPSEAIANKWVATGKDLDDFEKELRAAVLDYLHANTAAMQQSADASALVNQLQTAVANRKKEVAAWNEVVAILNQGVTATATALPGKKMQGVDGLKTAVTNALNTTVKYQDADGKEQSATVKDIISNQLPNLLAVDSGGQQSAVARLPDAPGFDVQILQLGLDLAQIERNRAQMRLDQLRARAKLYEDAALAIVISRKFLSEVVGANARFPQPAGVMARQAYPAIVYQNWNKARRLRDLVARSIYDMNGAQLAQSAAENDTNATADQKSETKKKATNATKIADEAEQSFTADYFPAVKEIAADLCSLRLGYISRSIVLRSKTAFELSKVRLDHIDSVLESQFNDEAWRTTIESGVSGLVTYENGGLTASQVGVIISLAQQAALWYIGINAK